MSVDIRYENVSLTYRGRAGATKALDNLDFKIAAGSFVSILGPSGCGKSTLIKLTSGLLPASGGNILLGGTRVEGPHKDVGLAFQKPTLLPWKTVLDNVLVSLSNRAERNAATERAREMIKLVRLEGFEKHYPHELSGGMQQRVALARALLLKPSLLLMDEPFAALDALTREEMSLELLKLWSTQQNTVIFVTHSIPEAVFLSDRIIVLSPRPARIVKDITVDLPRPRSLRTMAEPEFARLSGELREVLFDLSNIPVGATA